MVISFPLSISNVSFTCNTFGCLHNFKRFAPFLANSNATRSFSLSLILHVNTVTTSPVSCDLPSNVFQCEPNKVREEEMISPPTISCASFGPDWKREPIADPKYELIGIVLRVLLFLCSLSRARVVLRVRVVEEWRKKEWRRILRLDFRVAYPKNKGRRKQHLTCD